MWVPNNKIVRHHAIFTTGDKSKFSQSMILKLGTR